MTTTTAEEAPSTPRGGSWVLGVCMGLSNVLGYAFVLIVSRSLGPADFGAFSAVNNSALFLTLPASAFQVVVAAHQARGERHRSGIGLAVTVGGALALLTVALAPVLTRLFHLDSAASVLLLALMLPAFMVTGATQGLLLGHQRYAALAAVYVAISVARVLAALVAAALGATVAGVFAWLLVAAWLPALLGLWLARRHVQRWSRIDAGLVRELLTSNGILAVLLVMTSSDVLLARHFLTADEAGAYAFAGLFGKVVYWGTQFVALALVPSASAQHATGRSHRGPAVRAMGLVVLIGAGVAGLVALVPRFLVETMGGADYRSAAELLLPFTVLGTLWALCQVLLFAEIARSTRLLGAVTAAVTLACVGAVSALAHDTAQEILTVNVVAAGVVVLVGTARLLAVSEAPGGRWSRS